MNPEMSLGHWLLATLTAGVGGSMLAIGSAAGVALMGTARGTYTLGAHLKWTPVIALGYAASIACHLLINARLGQAATLHHRLACPRPTVSGRGWPKASNFAMVLITTLREKFVCLPTRRPSANQIF